MDLWALYLEDDDGSRDRVDEAHFESGAAPDDVLSQMIDACDDPRIGYPEYYRASVELLEQDVEIEEEVE